jgi:hypothetical protein
MQLSGGIMEGQFRGPTIVSENYMDQLKQSKSAVEAENSKILEVGEVMVLSFDRI